MDSNFICPASYLKESQNKQNCVVIASGNSIGYVKPNNRTVSAVQSPYRIFRVRLWTYAPDFCDVTPLPYRVVTVFLCVRLLSGYFPFRKILCRPWILVCWRRKTTTPPLVRLPTGFIQHVSTGSGSDAEQLHEWSKLHADKVNILLHCLTIACCQHILLIGRLTLPCVDATPSIHNSIAWLDLPAPLPTPSIL